jgi:hypothetical protein
LAEPACGLTLDDVDLAERGIAFLAVGQLARQGAAVERPLAADEIAGLARASRARAASTAFRMTRFATFGFSRETPELVVDDRFDDALHFGVAELRLGLPLELRDAGS